MTREELCIHACKYAIGELTRKGSSIFITSASAHEGKKQINWVEVIEWLNTLEQQPCDDWYDVPSGEMTLEQARQAVKDLRKKLREYLEQQPCDLGDAREDFMHDVYNTLDFLPTNNEANRIIDSFDRVTRGLEQQPCEDAVSRQAVEKMIKAEMPERGMWEIEGDKEKETVCEVCVDLMQKLSELPPVTPKEKTGKWITEDMFGGDETYYRCSECNELFWIESGTPKDNEYNFCPNCGARMVSE